MAPEFDYVIVGAGSAGCVLANRLSEDTATKVLLLEAGGRDSSMWIDIPAGFEVVMNTASINWGYESEPETHLDGRVIDTPRGKVLGGSSSINGMMFVRGNPLDYENWVEMGAAGWSYPEVLPYFKRSESFAGGGDDYRGGDGPLLTRQGSLESPLYRVFFEAAKEAGYLATPDHNGYQQEGFGPTSMSVNSARRCSTARGYLHPIRHRNNLKVETDALVSKLAVTGNRVGGVVYEQAGTRTQVAANREVILSAGSFNSPKLMMLSGLGPAPLLKEHGIAVKQSLPGVGENLIDHMGATVQVECAQPVSVQPATHGLGRLGAGLRWMVFKSGPAASNQLEGSGFIRTRAGVRYPDLQLDFMPVARKEGRHRHVPAAHGYQLHCGPMRPHSRGWVRLASNDPRERPRITYNYLAEEQDRVDMRNAVRLAREIFNQPAFDRYRKREIEPGPSVESDEDLDGWIRSAAKTVYHPTSTCRMGTDAMAVVDPQCRVHGIAGLRVVDTSIMPLVTSGNTNAPTIMIAEKAADMIKGVEPLPSAEVDFFIAEDWQSRQRQHEPVRRL